MARLARQLKALPQSADEAQQNHDDHHDQRYPKRGHQRSRSSDHQAPKIVCYRDYSHLQPGAKSAARRSHTRCWLSSVGSRPVATLQVRVTVVCKRSDRRAINRRLIFRRYQIIKLSPPTTRWIPSSAELLSARTLLRFDGVRPTDSSSTPQYVRVT